MSTAKPPIGQAYKEAGVDIAAGYEAVQRITSHVESTKRPGVMGGIGGFGGLFALPEGLQQPVLVSGTDGVGTKLRLALELDVHDTIGQDLVAMCANDVVVQGAEPLFFLDYLATAKLEPQRVERIVAGIAAGCRLAGCALIGGETAEMPGFYHDDDYDLAGFCVGVVERSQLVDGSQIQQGDALIGLGSSGVHSNGFSLVRKLLRDTGRTQDQELLQTLLTPTTIYVKPVLELLQRWGTGAQGIKGMAHITGGGLVENIPRMLPQGLAAQLHWGSWPVPEIFRWLQEAGDLSSADMISTFNMGLGFVLAVPQTQATAILDDLAQMGTTAHLVGTIVPGEGLLWKEPMQ